MAYSCLSLNFHKFLFDMPVYNPSDIPKSLIENLIMASSDTRQLATALAASTAAQIATRTLVDAVAAKATATDTTLTTATLGMVTQREYSLPSAAFTLVNGVMTAEITHDFNSTAIQMSLTDSSGDEQGFSQLTAKSSTKAIVELTPTQHADNSYPLTFLLQGKRIVVTGSTWYKMAAGIYYYRLQNGFIDRSTDGTTVDLAGIASGVTLAKMSSQSTYIYVTKADGIVYYFNSASLPAFYTPADAADYQNLLNNPATITLN